MYNRKSTKGIKRGAYKKHNNGFEYYVAETFCKRFNELDITQKQLLEDGGNTVSHPTLTRILRGYGGASINTIAAVADMLGLEIIIKPKTKEDENID